MLPRAEDSPRYISVKPHWVQDTAVNFLFWMSKNLEYFPVVRISWVLKLSVLAFGAQEPFGDGHNTLSFPSPFRGRRAL